MYLNSNLQCNLSLLTKESGIISFFWSKVYIGKWKIRIKEIFLDDSDPNLQMVRIKGFEFETEKEREGDWIIQLFFHSPFEFVHKARSLINPIEISPLQYFKGQLLKSLYLSNSDFTYALKYMCFLKSVI